MTDGYDPCPLCGRAPEAKLFDDNGYDAVRCGSCGLIYIQPYPDPSGQHGRVRTYNYDHYDLQSPAEHYRASAAFYDVHWPRLRPWLIEADSVLDVGCGTGWLLELLREANPSAELAGVELNDARREFAQGRTDATIYAEPVEQLQLARRFEAIALIHVLSHVPDIAALFDALKRLLRPGGRVVMQVGELSADVRHGDLPDWGFPDHLHMLGLETLDCLCGQLGWRVVHRRRVPWAVERYSPDALRHPGGSAVKNILKRVVAGVPGAARCLGELMAVRQGRRAYSSLAVLQPR
ncbi:MAG: class I SAM-dependent methyltransferase [Phycisphaerae bacterium]